MEMCDLHLSLFLILVLTRSLRSSTEIPLPLLESPSALLTEVPEGSGNLVVQNLTYRFDDTFFQDLNENDIKYFFCSRSVNETQFNESNATILSFNSSRETIIMIHGWLQSYQTPFPQQVKDAYLATRDVNIILVDWSVTSKNDYAISRYSVNRIGKFVGSFLQFMIDVLNIDLDNTAIVGFSLGAHVGGIVGRLLNGSVDHFIGLDPAGPLFNSLSTDLLRRDAAKFVQVIHTCAGYLGYPGHLGDADYWPNSGNFAQPGCALDFTGLCSHRRAFQFYAESLQSSCFIGQKCPNFISYQFRLCGDVANATMGMDAIDRSTGDYYLSTNYVSPYARC